MTARNTARNDDGAVELKLRASTARTLLEHVLDAGDGVDADMRRRLIAAVPAGRDLAVVMMPDQWCELERRAYHMSHVRVGVSAERRVRASRLKSFAQRIRREIERWAAHPAYKGRGALGTHPEVLTAWRCAKARGYGWPTWRQARMVCTEPQHGLLWPETCTVGGRRVTNWMWRPTIVDAAVVPHE